MEVFADVSVIPYGKQNNLPYNLNGIVMSPDQKSLIAVKTNDGSLWKIALKDRAVEKIALTEAVSTGDGLVWGKNNQLFVIRNFENKISVVDFNSSTELKAVKTYTPKNVLIPTGAAFVDGVHPSLTVVNSQFGAQKPVLPFTLTQFEIHAN